MEFDFDAAIFAIRKITNAASKLPNKVINGLDIGRIHMGKCHPG